MVSRGNAASNWPQEHGTPLFVVDHDVLAAELSRGSRSVCRGCRPITP